ncbi:translation initiation factor IF-2-like [Hyaena hyaena]|uniref:translation initiation factor IF-2-like n=1 Tax=Hyaena hyaena TaxID=95912 RepID=UPI0019212C8B|nr:translation initiation factor IF-2-like [Hyaena hyaena]
MPEEKRPLSLLGPNPPPQRPGPLVRAPRLCAKAEPPPPPPRLSQPEELVGKSVACKAQGALEGSAPRVHGELELRTRPTSHLPRGVQSPGPRGDQEKKERRFCYLGQDSQSGRSPRFTAGSRHPFPAASGRSSPESLGWEVRGGGREPEERRWGPGATHLPSPGASFGGVPRCGPPPPRQVLSRAGRRRCPGLQASQPVPAGNDCKSTLLFELPLGPPHRSPLAGGGGGALSRQPPGAGTEPGYCRASGRSLPGGCLRPGSCVNSGLSRSPPRSRVRGVCTADGCADVAVAAAAAF